MTTIDASLRPRERGERPLMSFSLPPRGVVLGVASLVLKEGATIDGALEVVRAAVGAGVLAIDTARAYATVDDDDDDAAGERIAQSARAVGGHPHYHEGRPLPRRAGGVGR